MRGDQRRLFDDERAPRPGRGRPGWIKLSGFRCKLDGRWVLDGTGFEVLHCGHPTANWPYYGVSPEGEILLSHGRLGRGFRTLVEAQASMERWSRTRSQKEGA